MDPASLLHMRCGEFSRMYRMERAELVPTSVKDCLGSDDRLELVFER
jgi:hypothetical protein